VLSPADRRQHRQRRGRGHRTGLHPRPEQAAPRPACPGDRYLRGMDRTRPRPPHRGGQPPAGSRNTPTRQRRRRRPATAPPRRRLRPFADPTPPTTLKQATAARQSAAQEPAAWERTDPGQPQPPRGRSCSAGRGASALAEAPAAALVAPRLVEMLQAADLVVANLECCISRRGARWPAAGKPFFFRAPPAAVERR